MDLSNLGGVGQAGHVEDDRAEVYVGPPR